LVRLVETLPRLVETLPRLVATFASEELSREVAPTAPPAPAPL
jgi:hypothetical protein